MKIFVIDWETTGRNVQTLLPLEFAIMFLDTEQTFPERIEQAEILSIIISQDFYTFEREEIAALLMNISIFEKLAGVRNLYLWQKFADFQSLPQWVGRFIAKHCPTGSELNFAGKNIDTFDVPLFEKWINNSNDCKYRIRKRTIDPTVMYTDFSNDECLPNMEKLLERMNSNGLHVYDKKHEASYDCWHIAQAIWHNSKNNVFE